MLVLLAMPWSAASAQSTEPGQRPSPKSNPEQRAAPAAGNLSPWEQFTKYFQVRKAFDGGKDENEAGVFGIIAPGKGSPTYWLVDAGVRLTPQDKPLNKQGNLELFYYPSVEWHHMSAEPLLKQDAANKTGAAFNTELWFPPVTTFHIRTYLAGKASLQRNFIKDTTENSVTLVLGACAEGVVTQGVGWENGFRPCAELTYNGARRLRYYPYVGYEHYGKVAIASQTTTFAPAFDGSLFLIRLQADAYPFNSEALPGDIKGFVLNFDYAYRRMLDDNPGLDARNLNMLKLGATYFFVKGQVAGVGLTIDLGRSPAVNFVSQRRVVLALRIKTKT
ncbi:MAG: hypothetical protein NT151_05640 [Acidobacteria bacterium]|nr:hypothetical protein [Acidobacteriota bacterium]